MSNKVGSLTKSFYLVLGGISVVISCLICIYRSFIYSPHSDFYRYIRRLKEGVFNDAPISNLAMKVFYDGLGKNGLSLLTCMIVFSIIAGLMIKLYREERYFLFSVLPILIVGNLAMRATMGGLLRSLIGFSIILYAGLDDKENLRKTGIIIILTTLTYFPATIYYIIYKTLKGKNLKQIYIFAFGIVLIACLGSTRFPYWYNNIFKTLELITPFEVHSLWYKEDQLFALPSFFGWTNYVYKTNVILLIGIYDYVKTKNKESLVWTILYASPFIPYRGLWLSKRLMRISWMPFIMILYHSKDNNFKNLVVVILCIYFSEILHFKDTKGIALLYDHFFRSP